MPIPKPINLLGQISPLKAATNFSTDLMNSMEIGIDIASSQNGCLAYQPHFMFP